MASGPRRWEEIHECTEPALQPLGVEHLQAAVALDQRALGGLWTAAQWQVELAEPRRPCVGLWSDRRLTALASGWLVVDELHITAVAVDPGCRRQGCGRQVLEALLSTGLELGARRATLEVSSANTAALALYQRLGFVNAGVRRAYYRNGEDALIQWLKLC